jgi:hypothetical protein
MMYSKTTRPIATTGAPSRPAYSGAGTQKINPRAEIIRFPSGSLLRPETSLEPLDLAQARLNRALMFALLVNFGIWGLLAIAIWALFFAAF